jgi:hypothetical protein
LSCAELVLSANDVPKSFRKKLDEYKQSIVEQAEHLNEHPVDEACEMLTFGVLLMNGGPNG